MLTVDKITLVEFYKQITSATTAFRVLILALIRDADAPNFYSDVERYWGSLDDVTGRHALFAIAAQNAAAHFRYGSVVNSDDYSPNIAVPTSRYHGNFIEFDTIESMVSQRSIRHANTFQVSELRYFLQLGEDDVPCLHLTLLGSSAKLTVVLRLKDIPDFSIYTICKDIMTRLLLVLDKLKVPYKPCLVTKDEFMRKGQASVTSQIEKVDEARRRAERNYRYKNSLLLVRELPRLPEASRRNELLDSIIARCTDAKRKVKWANPQVQRAIAAVRNGLVTADECELLKLMIRRMFSPEQLG